MLKNRKVILLITILTIGVFLRLWLSHFRIVFIDYDPFYHARMAEYIYNHSFLLKWDPKELGGIPYYYPPVFHITIAISQYIFTTLNSLEIGSYLNVFFGVLSILFLYLLTREEYNAPVPIIAAILFAVSPALVFRTTLWARPNALNILLPILAVYVFLKLRKTMDIRWYLLALLVSIFYVFSHSFVIITLFVIWTAILFERRRRNILVVSSIIFITSIFAIFYYYRFLPYLNFSLGYTAEYQPLIVFSLKDLTFEKLLTLDLYYWGSFLSFYHLSIGLPLIVYGIFLMYKRGQRFFLTLTIFSLISVFFKLNITLSFLFLFCIAMALSISEIYYNWQRCIFEREVKVGWALAISLMLILVVGSIFLTSKMRDTEFESNTFVVQEVLVTTPLSFNNTIISNDPNLGHLIAYYSNANTFNSDLTDVKQWGEHMMVYELLRDKNYTVLQALNIMNENSISHLLLVFDNQTKIFPFAREDLKPNFVLMNEAERGNKAAKLFKIRT